MKLYKQTICTFCLLLISVAMMTQNYKVVTVTSFGELQDGLGDDWDKIDSIVVKGPIDKTDFRTLYDCSRLGKLSVINLEHASVEDNRIPDFALYYPDISMVYLNIQRIILPDNVIEIGKYAFGGTYLKDINFPASLKRFSAGSFKYCYRFGRGSLVIPEGITEIPRACFYDCGGFKKLVLPPSLKTIGDFSFWNTRMEEMNLPDGLERIGDSAFCGSGELKRVTIPESVTFIGEGAFSLNDSLRSINIPFNLTEVPGIFAAYNKKLDSIIMSDNITVIGGHAFQWDSALRYVRWPKYLKRVETYAFDGAKIVEIAFPETIEYIGISAFDGIGTLNRMYCMAKTPPTAVLDPANGNCGPFDGSGKNCTLYVPVGSGDLYRTASGWEDFHHIVETDNFPSSLGITFAPDYKVTSSNGTITVNNPNGTPLDITVYTIDGTLIHEEKVTGTFTLEASPGIYLIKTDSKTHKVIVR